MSELVRPSLSGDVSAHIDSARQMSFAELSANATFTFDTGTLERDKAVLIGVPHVITRATFRPITLGRDGEPQRGFVSLECKIADIKTLEMAVNRSWIPGVDNLSALSFIPEENIVYNDGSTGIRRQIVQMLTHFELIEPGVISEKSDFDRPWTEWDSFASYSMQSDGNTPPVQVTIPDFPDLRVPIVHGLRASEYDAFGQAATTYYLS